MKDKIALITGSTQGIGKATAHRLYDEGATVILNGVSANNEEVIKEFSDKERVRFCSADIAIKADVDRLAKFVADEFGRLDFLVANAGVMPLPAGIKDITAENIDRTIDVNLKGTFQTLQVLGEFIQKTSKNGSIVTLTSVDGIIGEPYAVIYSATKAGIISMTKSFARSYKNPLVRVNAIAPGLIDTPLTASSGEDPAQTTDLSVIERIGKPEEVAAAITFLLSEDASFITGQVLAVDGGFTLK
ncbi:MAG: SDR family NAD(P)-dependent oxidoreductase [bacterium]